MAREFNVTAANKFFLGDDKVMDLTVFGPDEVTPFDLTGIPLEWNLRKKDNSPDPAILTKVPSLVGIYNADPMINTQRARIIFASSDTDPLVTSLLSTPYTLKANVAYRHSMKRKDGGAEAILTYGSFLFLQATER